VFLGREGKYYPLDHPDPIEAILHQMECQGLTHRGLEAYPGKLILINNYKKVLSMEPHFLRVSGNTVASKNYKYLCKSAKGSFKNKSAILSVDP